ncbi:MAG: bifunctional 2-methylcitrate dehydratase/aconitate hydratase [Gammaproteobacteria bacterium]|nr:bifunctional 2-methylcitrate dehydratase/aconitate hydratase [Gammaproteobacteria bacterium]
MSHAAVRDATRPQPDLLLQQIADYVITFPADGALARDTARHCLMDALGCALLALQFPACTRLLGPTVPGAGMPGGTPIPGTAHELDPVAAAFNLGALIRWLDFNDTWLAAEWGHPSDNLGGILAAADYQSRRRIAAGKTSLTIADVITAAIKAHEIQGVLALNHAFNRVGLDHVLLVRIASSAVVTHLLGGNRAQVINAVSQAFVDGGALRTYRHAPNTGSRKSWAAGDATSRAVRLALLTLAGEQGYPSALTVPTWGFQDALFRGQTLVLERPLGSYVMEHVLFKISFPAEFHAQTAVECALRLHPLVRERLDHITKITIETQEAGARIIDKTGPLANPADRDHCIQYMVAIPLLHGRLTAADYEDDVAADPRIDRLRGLMEVRENPAFSRDYLDPDKRAIGNAVQVFFDDGSHTERVAIDYPIGHRRRRAEGIPLLLEKFQGALATRFAASQARRIASAFADPAALEALPVPDFMDLWRA